MSAVQASKTERIAVTAIQIPIQAGPEIADATHAPTALARIPPTTA